MKNNIPLILLLILANPIKNYSQATDEVNKILFSKVTGSLAKDYLSRNLDLFINKKTGIKEKSNVLFIFIYKNGINDNIKPDVKTYIVQQFKKWVENLCYDTSLNLNSLKEDSLFRVELMFTVNPTPIQPIKQIKPMTSLDAFITTRVYITKNGVLVLDDKFDRSRSLWLESNDPFTVLDNVIKNSEKKITKVLGKYLPLEQF